MTGMEGGKHATTRPHIRIEKVGPQLVPYVHQKWRTDTAYVIDKVKVQKMILKLYQTFNVVVVHFADILTDCIARVVGHVRTIFFAKAIGSHDGRSSDPSRFPCIG